MSAESELLIKIRTILESQGIDAAKKGLDDLSKTQQSGTLTQGQSIIEMHKATRAAFALRMAADGSTAGFKGLTNAAMVMGQNFGMLVGKLSMVGAAFAAGWKIGTVIREQFTEPLSEAEKALEDLGKQAEESSKQLNATMTRVNNQRFDKLSKEISAITTSYNDSVSAAERLLKINLLISKSDEDREIAALALEAATTGMTQEDQDSKALDIRRRYEVKNMGEESEKLLKVKNSEAVEREKSLFNLKILREGASTAATNYEDVKSSAEQHGLSSFLSTQEISNKSFDSPEIEKRLKDEEQTAKTERIKYNRVTGNDELDKEFKAKFESADWKVKKLQRLILDLPKLALAANAETQAVAEFNKSSEGLESKIALSTGKLEEIEAQISALATRRETAETTYNAQVAKKQADWQAKEEEKDPIRVAKKAATSLVDALYVEDDTPLDNTGQPMSAAGQKVRDAQRRLKAVNALRNAHQDVVSGGEPEAVWQQLTATLDSLGVTLDRTRMEKSEVISAIDRLDGIVGKLSKDVTNLKSRETVAQGLD